MYNACVLSLGLKLRLACMNTFPVNVTCSPTHVVSWWIMYSSDHVTDHVRRLSQHMRMKHKVSNCLCLVYPLMLVAPPHCTSMLRVGEALRGISTNTGLKRGWNEHNIHSEGAVVLTQSKWLIMLESYISPDSSVHMVCGGVLKWAGKVPFFFIKCKFRSQSHVLG